MKIVNALSLAAFFFTPLALAASAHVHGAAKLDISVEANKLTIAMEMPLDNTVGFERPARTGNEKLAYVNMIAVLKNTTALFVLSPVAACRVESTEVRDPFAAGKTSPDGHADVEAEYVFRCGNPTELKGVETALFKQFKRLRKIEVQRATPNGQGKAIMTRETPRVNW